MKRNIYLRGRTYWIRYRSGGITRRESTRSHKLGDAEYLLKLREGDSARGIPVTPKSQSTTVAEILQSVLRDYKKNDKRSYGDVKHNIEAHLQPYLGHLRAAATTTHHIEQYIEHRQKEEAANGTINRELSALKRAFRLGHRHGQILSVGPYIPMLPEAEPRKGYFTDAEFENFVQYLPPEVQPLVRLGKITGWRMAVLKDLQWRHIDWNRGVITLDGESSTKRRASVFPFRSNPEIVALLESQKAARFELCPYVFHREGQRIDGFRKSWKTACKVAKLLRIPHDLRRTAARSMIFDHGISLKIAMRLMGIHSVATMLRYLALKDVDDLDPDLERAVAQLAQKEHITAQAGQEEKAK